MVEKKAAIRKEEGNNSAFFALFLCKSDWTDEKTVVYGHYNFSPFMQGRNWQDRMLFLPKPIKSGLPSVAGLPWVMHIWDSFRRWMRLA